ncbi:MAG: response regulator transcription factor [Akkermansiaceae bacterium]|jgi:two-component system, OmpR family, phosphate regulon response regulator PhoB|nr:response regulator transcription factor [Akkermansiaceae bacterium]MDP4645840.1 response regulator transcription factor [Akkermansiaceae bacterium]MDP4720446.1 response regulator transcription factor [Akkermansiaceae bacterium]MDP4779160.1 response regulator transcription factor [Akkermansiaceae bacterium]MDP4848227.1 response regulator transcription factor [Akkermansiaceae bacterium]
MQRVLIVEDEVDIADLVMFNLQRAGYEVLKAHDGIRGTEMAIAERPDLIVLDLMLPGRDGYSVFREVRRDARSSHIPIIMLTARAQTEDRIQGLEAGADDYLSKPFSPKELVLRVNAILKRSEAPPGAVEFEYGPFRFDKNAVRFYLEKEPVDLTSTEFKLLLYLCERAEKTQDRNDLLRTVWGYSDEVHSRTLDTHMKRLRQKLGSHGAWVETVRGIGYRAAPPEA